MWPILLDGGANEQISEGYVKDIQYPITKLTLIVIRLCMRAEHIVVCSSTHNALGI